MSDNIVENNKELEFLIVDETILDLVFHMDILMHNIQKYDEALAELINDGKDYKFLYEEFIDIVDNFRAVAEDLKELLERYFKIEKELNIPSNFVYRRLLKSITEFPIPKLKV